MTARAAGARCHSGWAVLVVAGGTLAAPVVHDRRRVELIPPHLPTQPYHAVAEAGADPSVIDEVMAAAVAGATSALQSMVGVGAVGVVGRDSPLPAELAAILRVHAMLHAAEGRLYEQAVIDAAGELGLPVHLVAPANIEVPATVDGLRPTVGSPWQKDHKWATVAALTALG